ETGNGVAYEVYMKYIDIQGNDIAKYCLVIERGSQIEFDTVYLEKATIANAHIDRSFIITFNRLYSYYSPIAVQYTNSDFVRINDSNLWENDTVIKLIGRIIDLQILGTWVERFNQGIDING